MKPKVLIDRFVAGDELRFLRRWVCHPLRSGAIMPSGRKLAAAMAEAVDVEAPGVVVELGPGTGPITQALLEAGVPQNDLILIERDPHHHQLLSLRFGETRVWCADAGTLPSLLKRAGVDKVKAVVSSLPLLSMTEKTRCRIIKATFDVLGDEGQFVQFTYGLNNPVPRRMRHELGITGERYQWVPWNVPPATVWNYYQDK